MKRFVLVNRAGVVVAVFASRQLASIALPAAVALQGAPLRIEAR